MKPWILHSLILVSCCGIGLQVQATPSSSDTLHQLSQRVFKRVFTAPNEVYPVALQLWQEAAEAEDWVMQSRAHYYLSAVGETIGTHLQLRSLDANAA